MKNLKGIFAFLVMTMFAFGTFAYPEAKTAKANDHYGGCQSSINKIDAEFYPVAIEQLTFENPSITVYSTEPVFAVYNCFISKIEVPFDYGAKINFTELYKTNEPSAKQIDPVITGILNMRC